MDRHMCAETSDSVVNGGEQTGTRADHGGTRCHRCQYSRRGNGERTMKGICKRAGSLLLTVVLVAALCGGLFACSEKTAPTVISIGATEKIAAALAPLVEQFNGTNDAGARTTLHIYRTEEIKNYYLSHGKDDCDLYTFDYAVSANRYRDNLASLDRNVYANRYMVVL